MDWPGARDHARRSLIKAEPNQYDEHACKGRYVAELTGPVGRILPECRIRYAF